MSNNEIINLLDKPVELEMLYRSHPKQFISWLADASLAFPESETLKIWNARINYSAPNKPHSTNNTKLILVVVLSLLAGILVKLPVYLPISSHWFYPRFIPVIVFGSLILYFLSTSSASNRHKITILAGVALCIITIMIMPYQRNSASLIMSILYMPFVLASLLALSYMANEWKNPEARLRYIRYVGDTIIYATLILLGGMVLTLLTLGLFNLINISIQNWYMSYVVVFGMVASPIVATYLYDAVLNRDSKLATLIANIFAPLFLMTVVVYLLAMLYGEKSPYSDRNFLIAFNGLLIIVWGITVFSISGRSISLLFNTIVLSKARKYILC